MRACFSSLNLTKRSTQGITKNRFLLYLLFRYQGIGHCLNLCQMILPKMSLLQAPGLAFSWPVWRSLRASSLSWTTLSNASMESITFSNLSGLGIGNLCRLASCSRVRSMFLSFRRTYQSLCKSSLLLFRNCWQVHEAPDFTFSSPQFFGSSKNSSSPLFDNVVWSNLHWWKDVTLGVFLVNRLRENLQLTQPSVSQPNAPQWSFFPAHQATQDASVPLGLIHQILGFYRPRSTAWSTAGGNKMFAEEGNGGDGRRLQGHSLHTAVGSGPAIPAAFPSLSVLRILATE